MERQNPAYTRKDRRVAEFNRWMSEPINHTRGQEYAAYIFNAVFGDNTMFEFNGNVRNWGLIDNLPAGCCVEVPVLASKGGLKSMHVGALPPQLAILNNINAQCEELAVEGMLEGDREKIFHACLYDPLTSALLSMAEIKEMVDKMFAAESVWLGAFQ
jgi:alpha-galactosidase